MTGKRATPMANSLLQERTTTRALRLLVCEEEMEQDLRPSESERTHEERLRLLLEITNILPWEADAESGRFTYIGEPAVRMLGYPVERWYEAGFWASRVHPDDLMRAAAERLNNSKTQDSYDLEYRMITRDGRTVWLQDIVSVIRRGGQPIIIRGFLIDITERKRTEEALVNLSGRLINAQEEERKRIARELHDDLNQRMALLSIELEQLSQRMQKPRNLRPLVHSLQTKAQEISAEIHRLSYRLHPSKLDHLGLAAAVESLCDELSGSCKLKVESRQTGLPAYVPKDVRLCLFRIVQESLRNCVKHSGALRARVVLEGAAGGLRLSVSDDGCGFDTESGALERGLGFTSMRERLRLVGGRLQIYSRPSRGTRIEIWVPFKGEAETEQGVTSLLTGVRL
jgi:PAS domain S-box-containing protein